LDSWRWTIIANGGLMLFSKLLDVFLKTKTNDNNEIEIGRFKHIGKPIFEGEIESTDEKYDRSNKGQVKFKARYQGSLECGYFAAEITSPTHFPSDTFHLDNKSGNVTSFCRQTINGDLKNDWNINNISPNSGKLHGRSIKTKWIEWVWEIPKYAPKGNYTVKIGIWDNSKKMIIKLYQSCILKDHLV
jgi:hypothetical protein